MSLQRRFFLYFVAFSVVLTAAGGWGAWWVTYRALDRELDEKLRWVAGAAAEVGFDPGGLLALSPGDEDTSIYGVYLLRLRGLQRYVSAAWLFERDPIGDDHEVIVSTAGPDSLPIGRQLRFLGAYTDELTQAWVTGESTSPLFEVDGRLFKYGFVRVRDSDVMMAVLIPAGYTEALDQLRRSMVFGSVLAAVLAAVLAGILAGNVTRPLDRLSRAALRIQRGRTDEPVVGTAREDELGQLARAMDRMRVGIESRDRQLRLMLAQVAHEIRNPLGGMELLAAVAAQTEDREEQHRLLGRIREEVKALNGIIDEFLSFARPMEPRIQSHDARGPIRAATEILAAELSDTDGEVIVDLPDQPLMAWADPDHVKQVVLNLARNGAQAGTRVWVSGRSEDDDVLVSVRDDGPGVDPELRERIFDPFVTDKEQGAGLGLAIVLRLVEANGGRLDVDHGGSALGRGAEFRVYFEGSETTPLAEAPA